MYEGALMVRPVIDSKLPIQTGISFDKNQSGKYKIYPNPLTEDDLNIILSAKNDNINMSSIFINIYDVMGKSVYSSNYQKKINLSSLSNGIYIIHLTNMDKNEYYSKKIIINR